MFQFDVFNSTCLQLSHSPEYKWKAAGLPAKSWNRKGKYYVVPIAPNLAYMRSNYLRQDFTPEAIKAVKAVVDSTETVTPFPGTFVGTPMAHQRVALDRSWNKESFFYSHCMGAGKTFTILHLTRYLYEQGHISGLLVVCPATIRQDVWVPQIEQWLGGIDYRHCVLEPGKYKRAEDLIDAESGPLKIMIVSVQSLSNQGTAYKLSRQFLKSAPCAMAVDESSRIKNHKAARTKNVIDLGGLAKRRWCATGTKITQGIHDLWSQFAYLDWSIIGHGSYYTFKNRYVQMGGFEGKQIVGYNNVPELMASISPFIHVVRKEDANELPPKTYLTRTVEPGPELKKMYAELKSELELEYSGEELTVQNSLEMSTRLHQLCGGNFPYQTLEKVRARQELTGEVEWVEKKVWHTKPIMPNPKLAELLEVLEESDEKTIIWATFVPEIHSIVEALNRVYGVKATVAYYGSIDAGGRAESIAAFTGDPDCRFFVTNQQTGSVGLNLTAATMAVYYSNSFSLEDRLQSEDRCHRTGQEHPVTYVDIVMNLPVEKDVVQALKVKKSLATFIADRLAGVDQ